MTSPGSTPPSGPTPGAASPALGRLVSEARAVLDDGSAGPVDRLPADALGVLRHALRTALADPGLLPYALTASPALPPSGVGKYLLHQEASFTLLCLVTSPRALALTHDHGTWGLVGVYRGTEEEIRYVPVGMAADPALVGLAEISRRVYGPGGVMVVEPPPRDVHQVLNRGQECSVTIHLLGADVVSTGFRTYAPAHLAAGTGPMEYEHW